MWAKITASKFSVRHSPYKSKRTELIVRAYSGTSCPLSLSRSVGRCARCNRGSGVVNAVVRILVCADADFLRNLCAVPGSGAFTRVLAQASSQ